VSDVGDRARRIGAALSSVAVLALTACGGAADDAGGPVVSGFTQADDDGMHGAVLTETYTWPEGTLVDSAGDDFDLRGELEKPLTLVFFGYTQCPDICQAVMADLASAVARLDDSEADDVATWFVTTDPTRDDPATLRAYLDRFDPGFEGLTGPLDDIVEIAEAVHVPIERGSKLDSGGYEVTHGTPILAVTPDATVPILWTEGTSAAKLAEDIQVILSEGIPTPDEEQS
jgi:protein SCO1/2